MTDLSLNIHLRQATERSYRNLVNDLTALDEEKASVPAGTGTRDAIKIVAECAAVNGLLAGFLFTGAFASPSDAEREAFYASITTRQAALDTLDQNTTALLNAIDATSTDHWGDAAEWFFGPTTVFAIAEFASLHMMYHDGQLNFLHTLHGDSEMHWAA